MNKYRVTIVSAYHGNQEMTTKFMDNLKTKIGPNDRIILVSAGNETKIHWNYELPHKHIWIDENVSFSNSMNTGLAEAIQEEQEYICILGNDGFPEDANWLDKLIHTQKTYQASIVCPEPSLPDISVYERLKIGPIGEGVSEYRMFPAICWLMTEQTFLETGFFDERFKIGCYEDDDYVLRLRQAGGHIAVDHKVKLIHLLSQTFSKIPNSQQEYSNNRVRLEKKWEEIIK